MLLIKTDFVQQFFDRFEGHFTHALCRRTGSINVFLYAIGSRGVGRIRDGNANPRRCFRFGISFANSLSPTRDKRKEWEKESFIALILIHTYPCLLGITRMFMATHAFWLGAALNDVSADETTKTNKQTIEQLKETNMTQPAELDWSCHAIAIAWRRELWDSLFSCMIKYTTFSLG